MEVVVNEDITGTRSKESKHIVISARIRMETLEWSVDVNVVFIR